MLELSGVEHDCVNMDASPEELDASLLAFLKRPVRTSVARPAFWQEFSTPYQVEQLQRIIDRVAGPRPPVEAVHEAAE